MGLNNIRERAGQLHGELQIDSKPGRGTALLITIPLAPREQPRWDGVARRSSRMTEEKIRLLVVEDHTVVREGSMRVAHAAERYGCEVVGEAADGEEAIVKAEKLKPDVILMDLQMPKMGGIEATREIVPATRRHACWC